MSNEYKICSKCIMDNVVAPQITFDKDGVCCYCHEYEQKVKLYGYRGVDSDKRLKQIVSKIKKDGEGKKYDCVLGISGGVDSAYIAYKASEMGLRILPVHVDSGFNTEVAEENIRKICDKLKLDLQVVKIDWDFMKELQRAYMFSGLANLDVPQDHAFVAAVYDFAIKNDIKYMLNGSNLATEGILPPSMGHFLIDFKHIKSVYSKNGRGRKIFSKYPHFSLMKYYWYQKKIVRVNMLNYLPYSKKQAIEVLEKEFGWKYYGGKHFESIITRFLQAHYLPEKFGLDKKRAHVASLVVGGEMTREQALAEMEDKSDYTNEQMIKDRDFVLDKLDISMSDWKKIMTSPNKKDSEYAGSMKYIKFLTRIKRKKTISKNK